MISSIQFDSKKRETIIIVKVKGKLCRRWKNKESKISFLN